ncbi:MAG: lipid II flippase MurJ, partial [Brevinematia bacterium]
LKRESSEESNHISLREFLRFDSYIRSFIGGFFSVILLSLVVQVNGIVSRFFGSFFDGVVAASTNAYLLVQVPIGMFSVAVSIVGLKALSEHFSKNEIDNFRKLSEQSLKVLNFLIIPITTVMVILSYDIVRMIYRDISGIFLGSEGKYSTLALKLTQELFSIYAIATYLLSLSSLLSRISFARRDTRTPLISSIIGVVMNILANTIIFITLRSYLGIPLAFVISSFASLAFIIAVEHRNISNKEDILYEGIKVTIISIFSSFTINFLINLIPVSSNYTFSFLITATKILLSLTLTVFIAYIMGIKTARYLAKRMKTLYARNH